MVDLKAPKDSRRIARMVEEAVQQLEHELDIVSNDRRAVSPFAIAKRASACEDLRDYLLRAYSVSHDTE